MLRGSGRIWNGCNRRNILAVSHPSRHTSHLKTLSIAMSHSLRVTRTIESAALVEWHLQTTAQVLGPKPVPVPLCLPQISLRQTSDRTQASALRGRRIMAWVMARPTELQVSCCALHAALHHNAQYCGPVSEASGWMNSGFDPYRLYIRPCCSLISLRHYAINWYKYNNVTLNGLRPSLSRY
jgi:hypothetical protein